MAVIDGAGIIPSAIYNGSQYYYFGLTNGGKISSFGGAKNRGETNRACAVREFKEESLGAFVSSRKMKKILDKFKNVERVTNRAGNHVTYITPLKLKNNPLTKFQQKRHRPGLTHAQKEMQSIVAIKANDLRNLIARGHNTYQGHAFRGCLLSTLHVALANGQL